MSVPAFTALLAPAGRGHQSRQRRVSTPHDAAEREADRAADVVARGGSVSGWSFSSVASSGVGAVHRQEAGKPPTEEEKYKEAATNAAEAALETKQGKALKDKVLADPLVKKVTSPVGIATLIGAGAAGVGGLAAAGKELPVQPPKIPLDFVTPGLSAKVSWKGPVNAPTEGGIVFTYTQQGPKAKKSDDDRRRQQWAREAAELRAFQAGLKYVPGTKERKSDDAPAHRSPASTSTDHTAGSGPVGDAATARVDDALSSPGRALDAASRRFMESRFGVDFSAVRIHQDDRAAEGARSIDAAAFTVGPDVVFGGGRFDPHGQAGRRLLAHELAHVVQQSRATPGAVAQRQPKGGGNAPPAVPATTLDTLPEEERRTIQVVTTTTVMVPGVDEKFSTKGATSAFPANTTMVWDLSVPSTLQRGLKNVAGSLAAGRELTPAPLVDNSTITLELDLTAHGASKGLYRFTLVAAPAPGGKVAPPNRILVESLGAAAAPPGTTAPAAAKGAAPARDPVADKIRDYDIKVSYKGSQLDAVRAALAQVPGSHLAALKGLRFARDTQHPTDPKAAGNYDPKTHTITMFDSAFTGTQVKFKTDAATASSAATRAIVHEIGHALDLTPLRDAAKVREKADAAVNKLVQDYPDPKDPMRYRWDSEQSKADVDQRLAAQAAADKNQLSVRGRSGSQTVKKGSGSQTVKKGPEFKDIVGTEVVKDGFREAAKADGAKAVSAYGDSDWQENYAEAYSLYLTSPSTLRSLRPKVFAYLKRTLPQ